MTLRNTSKPNGGTIMRKLAFVLALLIGTGYVVSHSTVFAADDAAALKKCEAEKDAKKKEECIKKAKGG
jgi:hypothetical protein